MKAKLKKLYAKYQQLGADLPTLKSEWLKACDDAENAVYDTDDEWLSFIRAEISMTRWEIANLKTQGKIRAICKKLNITNQNDLEAYLAS